MYLYVKLNWDANCVMVTGDAKVRLFTLKCDGSPYSGKVRSAMVTWFRLKCDHEALKWDGHVTRNCDYVLLYLIVVVYAKACSKFLRFDGLMRQCTFIYRRTDVLLDHADVAFDTDMFRTYAAIRNWGYYVETRCAVRYRKTSLLTCLDHINMELDVWINILKQRPL